MYVHPKNRTSVAIDRIRCLNLNFQWSTIQKCKWAEYAYIKVEAHLWLNIERGSAAFEWYVKMDASTYIEQVKK